MNKINISKLSKTLALIVNLFPEDEFSKELVKKVESFNQTKTEVK